MMQRHALLYLGSRLAAACMNLAALAAFARLAGPAGYGAYLIVLAWAYVVHGFAAQWLRMAYFAQSAGHDARQLLATYVRILALLLAALALVALLAAATRLASPAMIAAVVTLSTALAIYDSVHEIGRTRLLAERVAAVVLLRAALVLGLGSLALYRTGGSPTALVLAVSAAHILATLPLWPFIARDVTAPSSREAANALVQFGWPLVPAFGLGALGANTDRLLLERFSGLAAVGPYGAVADFIRQLMLVVPESIASSYFAIAKAAHGRGDEQTAQQTLRSAFRAHTAVLAFGAAALLMFAEPAIRVLMGETYAGAVPRVLPGILLATVFAVFRSFYFGQVIFFTGASRLELISATALLISTALAAYALIPWLDIEGAALALAVGQAAALLVYVAARRRLYAMPVPVRDAAGIIALAAAGYIIPQLMSLAGLPRVPALILAALCLASTGLLAILRYDILELRAPVRSILDRA